MRLCSLPCWLAAFVVALTVLAPVAVAADESVDVSISDVRSDGKSITGMITLRSISQVQLDADALRATVGGVEVPINIRQDPKVRRQAMLLIDTSGSMGLDGMATVRAAVRDYLRLVPDDVEVGVSSFANTAGVDLAPTRNRRAVQRVVDNLVSRGDTSLYAGMLKAVRGLGRSGDRSIVLLSDGADTVAVRKSAALRRAVAALARDGVRVDVVRFRTDDPEAAKALRQFASKNGGSLVAADDAGAVRDAFRKSAKALDSQAEFLVELPETVSGDEQVVLSGVVGSTEFRFTPSVQIEASSPASQPARPGVTSVEDRGELKAIEAASQPWALWGASGMVALALLGLVFAVTRPSLHSKREQRVASIASYASATVAQHQKVAHEHTALTTHLVAAGDRFMQDRKSTTSTMALIDRADLSFRAGEWLLIRLAVSLVAAVVMAVMAAGSNFLLFVALCAVTALVGFILPQLLLRFLAARRARAFQRVLPDVLMLVATSLRSGFGLPQALDAVARDAAEPAAKEFSRALAETRIGTDVPDALDHMAERMDSTSLRWTVMAIKIQREVGGNLADTLLTTAATLRERENLHRMVKSLSAEGRLSAYILIALPIGLFLYLFASNREYISLLWTDPLGLGMLVAGVVLLVLGSLWMRKIVQIEV